MPTTTEEAGRPVPAAQPEMRTCPGCGVEFPVGGRGMGRTFHSDACRLDFRNAHIAEGSPLAPLIKAWHATRHAKAGTREAEICSFARRELAEMARLFLDRDADAGRDTVAYAGMLMDSGYRYIDKAR